MSIEQKANEANGGVSGLNVELGKSSTITLSIQNAFRIMELMQSGSFPIDAMKDGRYVAWDNFKNDICQKIAKG